jgi:PAS domain S-box-containing protein
MSDNHFNRKVTDQIDEGLITLSQGALVQVNHAMEALTGFDRDTLLDMALDQLLDPVPPLSAPRKSGDPAAAGTAAVRYESHLTTAHGPACDVAVSVHAVQENDETPDILIVRNIAEQKKMQQELLKSRQLESIAALSGGIAHDYNNLLTAIMGNISLVMTGIPEDDAIYDWLSQAMEAALIAKELTNRLITFSKGGAPQKTTVDIAGLIESATEFALSGSNIIAEFDVPSDLWCADVDRTQIGQAIHNLVINAREAMPEGGTLFVSASNQRSIRDGALARTGRFIVVDIKDTGCGIPPETLDHIFDPYFSTKEMGAQRGMGLGLSIANSIIEKHGGQIMVEAPPHEGARFKVVLPASRSACTAEPVGEAPGPPETSVLSGRLLVMDDEEMIRKLAGSMLGQLGFETEFAGTGEAAIAAYEAALQAGRRFDAVILDLTVRGGMGGKEAIRHLRALDPDVKAIVSSGYANDPGVTHFSEFGFCGVVAKPYRIAEIRQKLKSILGP